MYFKAILALAAALTACATTAPVTPHIIEIETTRFDGVHYPVPDASPAVPQPPPLPPEDPRLASTNAVARAPTLQLAAAADLHNAAVRDRETELVARQYLQTVEVMYQIVKHLGAGGAMADTLALRKWHADALADMGQLIEQAAALEGTYVDLAHETGVDLAGSLSEPGRAGRIRVLFRMTACVRRDLAERTRDGLNYLDARRRGVDDAEMRAALTSSPAEVDKRTDEMIRQTSATLACAQMVGRALGAP
jgi:hypothetical protein